MEQRDLRSVYTLSWGLKDCSCIRHWRYVGQHVLWRMYLSLFPNLSYFYYTTLRHLFEELDSRNGYGSSVGYRDGCKNRTFYLSLSCGGIHVCSDSGPLTMWHLWFCPRVSLAHIPMDTGLISRRSRRVYTRRGAYTVWTLFFLDQGVLTRIRTTSRRFVWIWVVELIFCMMHPGIPIQTWIVTRLL